MRVLTRYVTSQFLRVLALCFLAFLILFVMVDFLERVDSFTQRGIPFHTTALFFLYRIPELVFEMIPVAMLVATSVAIGRLSQLNEITAMKAGGVSLYRAIVLPVAVIGLAVSLVCMGINELVVPWTKGAARQIIMQVKGLNLMRPAGDPNVWFQGTSDKHEMIHIERFFPEIGVLENVTVYRLDDDFKPIGRLDARMARWLEDAGKWRLSDVVERNLITGGIREHKTFDREFDWKLEDFRSTEGQYSDTMSFAELERYISRVEDLGYDSTRYRVDLHNKLAFPFVCFVVPLVAIPFSLVGGRGAGLVRSLAFAVVVAVSYFLIQSTAIAVGHAGRLSPLVSAWITNVLFALVGSYRLLEVPQ